MRTKTETEGLGRLVAVVSFFWAKLPEVISQTKLIIGNVHFCSTRSCSETGSIPCSTSSPGDAVMRKAHKMHFWDVTAKDVFVRAVVKRCLCLGCCCTQTLPTRWPCTSNIGCVSLRTRKSFLGSEFYWELCQQTVFSTIHVGQAQVICSPETGQPSYVKIPCLFLLSKCTLNIYA